MTHDDDMDDLFGDAAQSYNAPPATPREVMWENITRARAEATVIPIAVARPAWGAQRWILSAAGIAAVLVAGIAIGRATRPVVPTAVASHSHTSASVTIPAPAAERAGETAEPDPDTNSATPATLAPSTRSDETTRGATPRRRLAHSPGAKSLDMSGDEGAFRLAVVEHLTRTEVLLTGFRAQTKNGTDAKMDAQFATLSRDLLSTTRMLLSRRTDDPTLTRLLQDLELVLMQLSEYATDGRRADFDAVNQSIEKRNLLPKLRSSIPAGTALLSGT